MSIFCCMAVSLYSVNLMYETQQPSYDIRDQFAHKKTSYNAKDTSKLFGSHQIYEWWLPEIIFFSPGTVGAIITTIKCKMLKISCYSFHNKDQLLKKDWFYIFFNILHFIQIIYQNNMGPLRTRVPQVLNSHLSIRDATLTFSRSEVGKKIC